MSQTIRRKGTATARRTAAQAGKARKVRTARASAGSVMDGVMAWMPFDERQLHIGFLAVFLAAALAAAWMVASMAGLPQMAGQQLAMIAGDAGFEVRRVDVRGVKHLNELKVYERVLGERNQPMPLVDLDAVRASLLELSWVDDARVSRQLPDTLVVDIVERTPHAVLRKADKLVLIDDEGHELEAIGPGRLGKRLIVSGPGAGKQVVALGELLEAAPALKPQVREAEWIGNRRWNLTFKTGQVLALPEGARQSAGAFVTFARLDGTNRLLGGKVAAFDMRAPDRVYMRIPGRSDAKAVTPAAPSNKTADAAAAAPSKPPAKQEEKD